MKFKFLFIYLFAFSQCQKVNSQTINLLVDANSYGDGCCQNYTKYGNIIMATPPFNSNGSTYKNFAVSGQTTQQMTDDFNSQVLPETIAGKLNILSVTEIGNDLYFNGNAPAAMVRIKNYCNQAKAGAAAKGAQLYIILTTLIHRDNFVASGSAFTPGGDDTAQYNIKINYCNAQILADPSFYDGLARIDTAIVFQGYGAGGYDADKIHPNNIGYQKIAQLTVAAIQRILNPSITIRRKIILQ